ncbi:MAG: hypothetical protein MUO77_12125 [Anaerolineales bacterium]|nr:hypothetical protein [Anaerolineales bacterium]
MNVQFATPIAPTLALPDRMAVLENLSTLRNEWEVAADGDSLINVSASVGLMLFDFTTRLGLTPEEQTAVLGECLFYEVVRKVHGKSV